ncbi:hypothetical protein [Glaciecola sp. KUL10]|uniref:hypothetical protein n=1 Tax=Glaciecola sp. (strain KUL10) TaxID=2161813 RepID=UPI000D786188|nr:hypothetical protein [Glaciecola sp. KUL10]GBL02879.1 hypothetical protein KUL10_01520 [Glaciecola sp. KUL10]
MSAWKQRLITQPELTSLEYWPEIPLSQLSIKQRRIFDKNIRIVACILNGDSLTSAAKKHSVSISQVHKILNRALGGALNEPPALYQALIPYYRVKKPKRIIPLDSLEAKKGHMYSFETLLEQVPNLRKNLDNLLMARLKDAKNGQVESVRGLFGEFKRTLEEVNWPKNVYPYTCVNCGYEALRLYFHRRKQHLIETTAQSKQAKKHRNEYFDLPAEERALREIQIDEKLIDTPTNISITFGNQVHVLRVSRFSLIAAVDTDTDCCLGLQLVFSRAANQQDMMALFRKILTQQQSLNLGEFASELLDDASYPFHKDGNSNGFIFSNIKLDNALIHLANSVRTLVCDKYGATLNVGRPAKPNDRNWIEFAMKRLNGFSHRLSSTTGTGISDDRKESKKLAKTPPIISFEQLQQALHLEMLNHNVVPQARLHGISPLAKFNRDITNLSIPRLPTSMETFWEHYSERVKKKIHGKAAGLSRFINFHYLKYTGNALYETNDDYVEIRFNREDIRILDVYSLTGTQLGNIKAPNYWQAYPYSIYLVTLLFKKIKKENLSRVDPFANYFYQLLKNKHKPSSVLNLTQLLTDIGTLSTTSFDIDGSLDGSPKLTNNEIRLIDIGNDESSTSDATSKAQNKDAEIPDWDEIMFNTTIGEKHDI